MAYMEFYSYKAMSKKGGSGSGYRGCELMAEVDVTQFLPVSIMKTQSFTKANRCQGGIGYSLNEN